MSYNNSTQSVKNKALNRRGLVPLYAVGIIGGASGQTAGTCVNYTKTTISNAGNGPAVDAALYCLNKGAPSVVIAAQSGLAAETLSAAAVYHLHGAGTGTIAISGTPVDTYLLLFRVIATGDNGTSTLQYSLDDGCTWSSIMTGTALAAAALKSPDGVSTGITATLTGSAGAFVATDYYGLAVYAPQPDTTDATVGSLADCEAKLTAFGDFSFIYLANPANHATTDATNQTSVSVQLGKLITGGTNAMLAQSPQRFFAGLCRRVATLPALMGVDHDATFGASAVLDVTSSDDRLSGVSAGYFCQLSKAGFYAWRPVTLLAIGRLLSNQNPQTAVYRWADGHFASEINTPISSAAYTLQDYTQRPLMYGVTYDESLSVSANVLGLLGPAGFMTLTSNTRMKDTSVAPERQFAFTAWNAHTSSSSDFFEAQYGITADVVMRVIFDAMAMLHGEFLESKLDGTKSLTDKQADTSEEWVVNTYLIPLVKKGYLRSIPADKKYINIHRDNDVTVNLQYDVYCPVGVYGRVFQGTFQLMA